MRRIIQLALLCSMFGISAACVSPAQRAAGHKAGESAAPLQDDALRILLNDVSVTDIRTARGDDGPAEIFRASGIYQRIGGRGVSNEARYEISDGAVCVHGDGARPRCRRVRANGDGTWTFINTADGTSAVMTVTPLQGARGNRTSERAAPLRDDALRVLLSDVSVTPGAHGGLDDGPSETFLANGIYQRLAGRGSAPGEPFEIRNGAVCVPNGGPTPRCRRVLANGDGTYTFINTADGTAVMTVTPLQGARGNRTSERATPLRDDALRALLVDAYVAAHGGGNVGPGEFFRANSAYHRGDGRGAIVFQGRFEIRRGAVCVRGGGAARLCRRVLANGDGTYTFINTANGTSAVMFITRPRGAAGNRAGESAAPLQGDALRALFVDVYVPAYPGLDDSPAEIFRANGAYQRDGGRGAIAFQGRFEIRDGAVCVWGEGLAPLCRRVLANGDGTYTSVNTADGTSAVMTIIALR
jgi:hypothetical protein